MTKVVLTTGRFVSPGGKDALVEKAPTVGEERTQSTEHKFVVSFVVLF